MLVGLLALAAVAGGGWAAPHRSAAAPLVAPAPPPPRAELTVRATDAALLEQRLIIDGTRPGGASAPPARSRLFMAYGYAEGGVDYLSGGFGSPELTVGSVTLQGLLREIYRPTRFSPSSDVYREPASLALDSSMAPPSRLGLQLQPWAAAPMLFTTVRENRVESVGLASEYRSGPLAFVALFRSGDTAAQPEEAVWYTEYPRFPGGRLHHGAAQLTLEGGGSRLSGMAALSGGPLVAASSAARLHGRYRAGALRLTGLWAASRPGYVTPDGRFWRDSYQAAAAVRLGRTRGPALEIEGSHRETRAPLRDGRVSPSRTEALVRLGTYSSDLGRQRVTAAAGLRARETVDDRGRDTDALAVESTLGVERPLGSGARLVARAEARRDWADGGHQSDRLETTLSVGGPGLTFDSRILVTVRDADASYAGRFELRARVGALRLYVRAATLEEITADEVAQLRSVPFAIALGGSLGFDLPWQPGRNAAGPTGPGIIPPTDLPAALRAPE